MSPISIKLRLLKFLNFHANISKIIFKKKSPFRSKATSEPSYKPQLSTNHSNKPSENLRRKASGHNLTSLMPGYWRISSGHFQFQREMLKRLNMFLWFCKRNLPSSTSTWAVGKELFNATVAQPFIIPFPHYRAFIYSLAQTSSKTSRSILCSSKQMGTLLCKSYTAIIHNIVPQERVIPWVM